MRLADSHAHVSHERFDADRLAVLDRARDAGVSLIVDVGSDVASSRKAVALSRESAGLVLAAVGIHPHEAAAADGEALDVLADLAREPHVAAIGETGLDFYRDLSPRDRQREVFACHLALAERLDKPVIVHSRQSHREVLELLRPWAGKLRAVLHCFSGDEAVLREALLMGLSISFAGTITYDRANEQRRVARLVPMDRLLIETDCPYLPPVPKRGRRNEPAYVSHVARALAEVHAVPVERLAEATYHNTEGFFGLGDGSDHR